MKKNMLMLTKVEFRDITPNAVDGCHVDKVASVLPQFISNAEAYPSLIWRQKLRWNHHLTIAVFEGDTVVGDGVAKTWADSLQCEQSSLKYCHVHQIFLILPQM